MPSRRHEYKRFNSKERKESVPDKMKHVFCLFTASRDFCRFCVPCNSVIGALMVGFLVFIFSIFLFVLDQIQSSSYQTKHCA